MACAGWSVVTSLPQPLMAVPAFLFVDAFRPALPYSIGHISIRGDTDGGSAAKSTTGG